MMFNLMKIPRVYGVPLGADFSTSLFDGLRAVFETMPPAAVARVVIYVNTRRLPRRLTLSLVHLRRCRRPTRL